MLRLDFSTLLAPGSVPTSKCVVAPETPPTTLPPKVSINSLALSLPRFKPTPPPSSGKMPVITNFLPESALRGRRYRNQRFHFYSEALSVVGSLSALRLLWYLLLLLLLLLARSCCFCCYSFLRAAAGTGSKSAFRDFGARTFFFVVVLVLQSSVQQFSMSF